MGLENIYYAIMSFVFGVIIVIILQMVIPIMLPIFDEMDTELIEGNPDSKILGDWTPFIKAVWMITNILVVLIMIIIMPVYFVMTVNDR